MKGNLVIMCKDVISGKQFGLWTVIAKSDDVNDNGRKQPLKWRCRCQCGTEKDVNASSLKRGLSKSCGCALRRGNKQSNTKDLTGMQFGRWLVLSRTEDRIKPKSKDHISMWKCQCVCGNQRIVSGENLKSGHSQSCGCLARETNSERRLDNLAGKRFGRLVVQYRSNDYIQPNGNRIPVWHCKCDCGKEIDVRSPNLRYGDTHSCGCLKTETASQRFLIDLTGSKFGRLTVVSRAKDLISPTGDKFVMWNCRCDCGRETVVYGGNLKRGKSLSCGCLNKEVVSRLCLDDLTGRTFGKLRVINRAENRVSGTGNQSVMWLCRCECGKTVSVSAAALKEGRQRTCGCSHKKAIQWIDGTSYDSIKDLCKSLNVDYITVTQRLRSEWSLEEAVKAPRNLSLGEYRIGSVLDNMGIQHIDNISIKRLLVDRLGYDRNRYEEFLSNYITNLATDGIVISKARITGFRFDFSLIQNRDLFAFIECDGLQHFQFVFTFFKTLAVFFDRCICDKTKNVISECNGIPLLRIRFDQLDECKIKAMIQDLIHAPNKYVYRHNTFLSEEEYWRPLNEGKWIVNTAFGRPKHTY